MIRLTLYKNCILNKTYQNVITVGNLLGEKSILEKYLDTLTSKQIEVNYAYQENSGTLVFDYFLEDQYSDEIYEYNYMKVETINDEHTLDVWVVRYCFIGDIKIKNELVYLDYEEDIWSSYSGAITGCNESYLCNSRVLAYPSSYNISFRKLPVEYGSNENLYANSKLITDTNKDKCFIVVELQYYVPDAQGNPVIRNTQVGIVDVGGVLLFNYQEVFEYAEMIYARTQVANGGAYNSSGTWYQCSYQINNIYIMPGMFYNNMISKFTYTNPGTEDFRLVGGYIALWYSKDNISMSQVVSLTFTNDFKFKKIGTLARQFDVNMNGTSFPVKFYVNIVNSQFNFYIDLQGQLYDITSDFELVFPYTYYSSETVQQQKISRELKNSNLDYERRTTIADIIFDQLNTSTYGFEGTAGAMSGSAKGLATAARATNEMVHKPLNSGFKLQNIKDRRRAINAKVFNTSVMSNATSNGILNGFGGIRKFMIVPDNETYVKECINIFGYEVFEIIKDISKLGLTNPTYFQGQSINYNSIKFDTVSVYGRFPQSIANQLNEILMSGIKIWYKETLAEDSLVVG